MGQGRRSVGRRQGAGQKPVDSAQTPVGEAFFYEIERTDYTLKQIVEIMRYTSGQLPESLHFLTLPQRLFHMHQLARAFLDSLLQDLVRIRQ
jgi:hypothetical protein